MAKTVTISPRQFDALQRTLYELELHGYGPEACVIDACKKIGIEPPHLLETLTVIVDPTMD